MTLQAALAELHAQGRETPCAGQADRWDSDDAGVRASAAQECAACPIVAACRQEAKELPYATGVWGGTDRSRRDGQPGRARYAFTPQQEAAMAAAARDDATFAEIAELIGASRSVVGRWLRENVPSHERRAPRDRSYVDQPWLEQAVRLRDEEHLSFSAIAVSVGVPVHQVRHAYHRAQTKAAS